MAVHSEDEDRLIARKHLAERGKPETHPVWRDAETARVSTERVLRLAKQAGRRLHVLHVTTGDEIPLAGGGQGFRHRRDHAAASHPRRRRNVTSGWAAYAQMNPPIRDESHRQALWAGGAATA